MNKWMNEWMEGWMNEWLDECTSINEWNPMGSLMFFCPQVSTSAIFEKSVTDEWTDKASENEKRILWKDTTSKYSKFEGSSDTFPTTGKICCRLTKSSPQAWLASPYGWLTGPPTLLADHQTWLAGNQTWPADPQALLTAPYQWWSTGLLLSNSLVFGFPWVDGSK